MDQDIRRQIILENYEYPFHFEKQIEDTSYIKVNANNESCIDNLDIYFKIDNKRIVDVKFSGEACAISTSATSIMLKNLIGKSFDEVKGIIEEYKNMINEEEYKKEKLNDLLVFEAISMQPNRKTCALLPIKAIEKILDE